MEKASEALLNYARKLQIYDYYNDFLMNPFHDSFFAKSWILFYFLILVVISYGTYKLLLRLLYPILKLGRRSINSGSAKETVEETKSDEAVDPDEDPQSSTPPPSKQMYDSFLVFDVEATCIEGTGFDWPNEIIEWPVCLLRWADKDEEGKASKLILVDEFRSYVKPTWKPQLSSFCTRLTGITQADVDGAPKFDKVLSRFKKFMHKHKLLDIGSDTPLERFAWCTDGPFDIRDFVVKQCFISKIKMPHWLYQDVLDVRRTVGLWYAEREFQRSKRRGARMDTFPRRPSFNITQQLKVLGLSAFEGRQHCGIDDTRNIARILTELARKGVRLQANTSIRPGRRWQWMGDQGEILEQYCITR